MAVQTVTKPPALDETLQGTNDILATLGKDTSLQAIATALATLGLTSVGDLSQLTTEQKTSLVAAINEINGDLTNYVQKSATPGLLKNDGTVDETPYTVVEPSTANGNIVIDDVETPVYRNYGNNAVLTTDKTPFLTRQTLNPTGFSGYVREKLIGCSVAWNNILSTQEDVTRTVEGITYTNNNNGSYTINGTATAASYWGGLHITNDLIANHVYLFYINSNKVRIWDGYSGQYFSVGCNIVKKTSWSTFVLYLRVESGTSISPTETVYPQIIDLTLAFGSTVADYLYNLSNNGGITKLRDMGCPIDKYTPYGYGLYSVKTSGKKIVGFNVWDEEWRLGKYNQSTGAYTSDNSQICNVNKIKVLGGKTYYASVPTNKRFDYYEYDANDNFIKFTATLGGTFTLGENTAYINFTMGSAYGTTYNNDICINISDANKNGQYEPYCGYEISLGNDELRGKFDLVNGEIVASGDVKESNGEITRNYGIVDLGSFLDWNNFSTGSFQSNGIKNTVKKPNTNNDTIGMICSLYLVNPTNTSFGNMNIGVDTNGVLYIRNDNYPSDAAAFKTAMSGVYLIYELATPTTEQSTPFADPMSLVGATTEEYIDDRDIPCPVGAERQYMGQSEDVVEIPSSPQSDGVWVQKCYVSGGKAQYVWELESTL